MRILFNKKINILTDLLLIAAFVIFFANNTSAAPVVGFEAGRIIDDVVMSNSQSMNVSQIQTFLNSKVPTCDTYGAQPSEYGGGTRAQWAANASLHPISGPFYPPFTCLKDYAEDGLTSSQIIYDAAQQYQINPQVLIVLLQKEQVLVTDTWPSPGQYRSATGYGCPDGADCSSLYYGFTNQVQNAASDFRLALDNSASYRSGYIIGNNYIQYNEISSCGGSNVFIQNQATRALYTYTPYQPNASALNAGYGSGDSCGAHGNRNFYLYFTDWFGSTTVFNGSLTISKGLTIDKDALYIGNVVSASYEVSNTADYDMQAGGLGICARLNNINIDFGWKEQNTIPANGKIIVSYSRQIDKPGILNIFICSYNEQIGGWANTIYPYNPSGLQRTIDKNVKENPLITSGVWLNNANPATGQPLTVAFSVENNSSNPINIGSPVVAVRDANGTNFDFAIDGPVIIQANSTYEYNRTRSFPNAGNYYFFVTNLKTNGLWDGNYPKSAGNNITRSGTIHVKEK